MKSVIHTENEPEVVSRITDLLIANGKTQTELLEYLGLNRNNYSEWKAGRKRSYLLYIDDIARYFQVSPTYLLRGGRDFATEEKELIRLYRGMSQDARDKLMTMVETLSNGEK